MLFFNGKVRQSKMALVLFREAAPDSLECGLENHALMQWLCT